MEWLEPYRHYVPLKNDFSDMEEKLLYARSHDEEMKRIADEVHMVVSYGHLALYHV